MAKSTKIVLKRHSDYFYGENHLLDRWELFSDLLPKDPIAEIMTNIPAEHTAWAEWNLSLVRNGKTLGDSGNEEINRIRQFNFEGYLPHIDNTALGEL